MAPLTMARAKWWSIALPVLAVGLALANVLWDYSALPGWSYGNPDTLYVTTSSLLALGVIFAIIAGIAAWLTGTLGTRKLATTVTLAWGLSFGAWFGFALMKLAMAFVDEAAIAPLRRLGSGNFGERMNGVAFNSAAAGLGTAALLWWMTGSLRVAARSALASLGVAALSYASLLPVPSGVVESIQEVAWHAAIGAILGQFVLAEARRQQGIWERGALTDPPPAASS